MNNSVPLYSVLTEVVSTLSVWIGNLVRLHKSIHICYIFLSRATVIIVNNICYSSVKYKRAP